MMALATPGLAEERTIVIARELTKVFESIASMPLREAPAWMRADANRQRGEFVIIVSGALEVHQRRCERRRPEQGRPRQIHRRL